MDDFKQRLSYVTSFLITHYGGMNRTGFNRLWWYPTLVESGYLNWWCD